MPWRRPHWGTIAVVVALAFGLGWSTRAPEVSAGGDEATYIFLSQSLEGGRYHDDFLVGAPRHQRYPPGNPAWILLVRTIAGPSVEVIRAANLLLLVLTGLLVGDALRRIASPWTGVAGVALTVFSPSLLPWAGTALSELPFTAAVAIALWAALQADRRPSGRWIGLSSAASILSFLTRTIGVATIAAVGLWLLQRRRWREAGVHGLTAAIVSGAWFAWTYGGSATRGGLSYAADFIRLESHAASGPAGLWTLAWGNASEYFTRTLPVALSLPTIPGTPIDNILWLLLLAGSLTAGLIILLRHWPPAAWYLLLSGGILLVWPYSIERLFAPLLPILAGTLLVGLQSVAGRVNRRASLAVPLLLALILVPLQVRQHLATSSFWRCDRQDPYDDQAGCYPSISEELIAGARFARDSLEAGAAVATYRAATVAWFSDHKTARLNSLIRPDRSPSGPDWSGSGTDYLLLANTRPAERAAARSLLPLCRGLALRWRASPTVLVLEPGHQGVSRPDACAALQTYLDSTSAAEGEPRHDGALR